MPLHGRLDENEIARVEDWIRNLPPDVAEATDTKEWRWPFEKPVKVQPPAGRVRDWVITPIDAFILEKLGKVGLVPAPPASKRVLARRVYVDLAGIPPPQRS